MRKRGWTFVLVGSILVWFLVLPVAARAGESIDTRQERHTSGSKTGLLTVL
jgi:hypothetical protein